MSQISAVISADKPNVILIMADDLGWGDVGFNGNKIIKTPHLDAMAANGMKWNRFYAAAPVCSPTRGSVLTGRHPFRYGIYYANTGHMKPQEKTLAEFLRDDFGYQTGHFGKWHLGTLSKTVKDANRGGPGGENHFSTPGQNGFQRFFSTESKVPTYDPLLVPKKPSSGSRKNWWDPAKEGEATEHYGTHYWDESGADVTDNTRGDDSRVIMDRAIPFIQESVKSKKPFFSVIWFHAPHLPVVAGPEHTGLYPDVKDGHTKHYYGCISALDEQVGRLRAELRTLGVEKNTLICFCSDNGPEGNDKSPGKTGGFRGRKRSLYEGGVRVPGLIEWPAEIRPGTVTDFPAVTSDYLPTILDALGAGLEGKRPLDGISLLPVIRGEVNVRPDPVGFQSRGMQALSGDRYKLVRTKNAVELYDIPADPGETNNLAAKEKLIVRQMTEKLDRWVASCKNSDEENDYTMSDQKPLFQFGVIADCQYADAPTPKQMPQRFYRLAKDKLAEAVTYLNTEDLAFTIHLGDFIDKNFVSFDVVGPIYDRLRAPRYHLLGNHDYSVSDGEKAKVVERLGMPSRYYAFQKHGWRFVVLDGNEVGTLAYPEGSEKWNEGEAYRRSFKKPPPSWSGGMGSEQMKWLEKQLKEAKSAAEPVILFCHYPVYPKGTHNLWNDDELVALVSKYSDTVVAWMNGHNHDGNYGQKDGVHYLNFKGMLDTRLNAYSTVTVFPDKTLKVRGFGREPDRVLKAAAK